MPNELIAFLCHQIDVSEKKERKNSSNFHSVPCLSYRLRRKVYSEQLLTLKTVSKTLELEFQFLLSEKLGLEAVSRLAKLFQQKQLSASEDFRDL